MTRPPAGPGRRPGGRGRVAIIVACIAAAAAIITAGVLRVAGPIGPATPATSSTSPPIGTFSHHPVRITLPARPASYLGVFAKGVPDRYGALQSFATTSGVRPLLQRLV